MLSLNQVKKGDVVKLVSNSDSVPSHIKSVIVSVEGVKRFSNQNFILLTMNSGRSSTNILCDADTYGKDWFLVSRS